MGNPTQEQFLQLMQSLLSSTENEIRSQAETTYDGLPIESRFWGTLTVIRSASCSEDVRSLACVLLRRLFTSEFEEFFPKITPEQQAQFKAEILNCVTQEQPEGLRRKVCDLVGEVVRNMINQDGANEWGEFLPFLFNCVQSPNVDLRVSALLIFQAEPNLFGTQQAQYLNVIKGMLGQSLGDETNPKIRFAAARALCAFIRENSEDTHLLATCSDLAGPLMHVMAQSMEAGDDDIIKSLIDVAESSPRFLRGNIPAVMELCLSVTRNRDAEDGMRELCLEVMVTLCETAAAMVRKVGAKYVPILIQEVLKMMTEVEEDEDWSSQDQTDDEGDSNAMVAESAIDRIACGLGGKSVLPHVLALLPVMFNAPEWQARHAALMALSAVGEGCVRQMSNILPSIMEGVVNFLRDDHPRVRYACCNAIGQMSSDFAPMFEKKFHGIVIPGLLTLLESDPNPRVQAHAGAALVNFAEDCPKNILTQHLNEIIAKLEAVLTCKFKELLEKGTKLVLEQTVTTIASVADASEEKFVDYYDRFMPCLKYIVQHATQPELKMLRGKTIECISLIGLAVGRDKFVKDASEVMDLLLRTQTGEDFLAEDDPQLSFMISAWARICKILGSQFEPYLPMVMGPVMRTAALKPEVTVLDADEMNAVNGHDEDWQFVSLGDQQNFGIRTSGLEEKSTACQMLVCYARELKEGFAEYAPEVVKLMVPLLKFYFHDGVRTAAGESLPYLLDCAKIRGPDYVREMWAYICPEFLKALEQEPESEVFAEFMTALAKCIDTLGPDFFTAEILNDIFVLLEKTMKEHFEKEDKRQEKRKDEDYDDEVEEQLLEDRDDDSYVMSRVTEVLHSLFKVYKGNSIFPYFDRLLPYCNRLLEPDRPWSDHQWGLCVFDDVIEFGGPFSEKYQGYFLEPLMAYVTDTHADVRQAAAYGIGILAQTGEGRFTTFLGSALSRLAEVINDPESRTPEKISPTENCISAVAKILKYSGMGAVDPNTHAAVVPAFLNWLPTWEDTEEAPHIYGYLADLVEANHPAVMSDVPAVMCVVAEAILREALEPGTEVYNRLLNIVRQVQNDEPLFRACLGRMTGEQQEAMSKALTAASS